MPPLLTTPTANSEATCPECGSTLYRTGKVATFSEGKKAKEYHGWIPSLLVTLCPTCDSRPQPAIDEDAPLALEQPTKAVAAEGYLERLAREADEAKESTGD